jgi:cyclopropane-fatty-acyl-phospholipid synthase
VSSTAFDRWLVQRLVDFLADPRLRFVLWDGSQITAGRVTADSNLTLASNAITLSIRDRATLLKLCLHPEWHFAEAYSDGRIEIDGDLVDVMKLSHHTRSGPWLEWTRKWLRRIPRPNTRGGSRHNIHLHYDLGNEFYRLWLDRELAYTCAYYADGSGMDLEHAQLAKMEHVCRKLQLTPGARVVEAGSGWGALAIYMARHHEVTVESYNISREQVAYARQRAREEGVESRVQFLDKDYREIEGQFDVFVSVGMLEHVGRRNYRQLGEVIDRVLRPDGRALIHSIGRARPQPLNAWIESRIFPGAYPPSLQEMMEILEPRDFAVLDVENLRLHYGLTLREWLARYEAALPELRDSFDSRFLRAWRIYLAGSVAAFEEGSLQLFQVVFNRATSNRVPMTRRHLYAPMTITEKANKGAASWNTATH